MAVAVRVGDGPPGVIVAATVRVAVPVRVAVLVLLAIAVPVGVLTTTVVEVVVVVGPDGVCEGKEVAVRVAVAAATVEVAVGITRVAVLVGMGIVAVLAGSSVAVGPPGVCVGRGVELGSATVAVLVGNETVGVPLATAETVLVLVAVLPTTNLRPFSRYAWSVSGAEPATQTWRAFHPWHAGLRFAGWRAAAGLCASGGRRSTHSHLPLGTLAWTDTQ